jgi:glycosyltransferase involved in cell wall biosynthesis
MVKILHTTTRLVRGGGVENNIFHSIDKLYHEFEFHLASGVDFQVNPFEGRKEVKIIICKDLVHQIHIIKDLKALYFFYRLIKKEKYDIVHTHETKASFITRLAAWLAGCKYIIYGLHGVTFNDPMSSLKRNFFILLEKFTVGVSDLIVAVSEDVIYHYHKNNIGKTIPYKVVRSGIEIEDFVKKASFTEEDKASLRARYNIRIDDLVISNVGRFSFSKAQRYTIESFSRLKKDISNLKLVLVGEGELLEQCKRLAADLGVKDDVIFTGYTGKVGEILSITDLFMFTSLREGLPRVIVEASLMKIPVVAFEVEGIREVITDKESGFIVKQYDTDLLTGNAKKLLENGSLRKEFGERSYAHVKSRWDANIMAEDLRKIYTARPLKS